MPIISVIIPCYNVQREMLMECIESVLSQSFHDFEVILVDDGSKNIFQKDIINASQMDNRIRVLSQTNQGCSAARNNGMKAATGEFIVFVDADDVLMPDFFSEAIDIQKETGADFIIGGNAHINAIDSLSEQDQFKVEVLTPEDCEEFKRCMLKVRYFNGKQCYIGRGPWSRLIKRELVLNTPFCVDLSFGEDILWNLELLEKCQNACIVYHVWYLYRKHNESAVRKYNDHVVDDLTKELNAFIPLIDLTNDAQYAAYCCRILGDVKQVFTTYFGRKECPLSRKEKNKIAQQIYISKPWKILGENRFRKIQDISRNQKVESWLFQHRCLFSFYNLERKGRKVQN